MAKGARHDLKGKGKARERTYGKARDRTRGDKPRLIEDPELEERVLSSQLKEAGLYAANILGDGNCLFRALSDQLYGSPSMHQAIRQEICDYLAAHPDKYRLFVDEDSVKGGFDGHVREMRQNGTYGTNIELSAFVARYRRPVKVYQPNLVYVLPVEDKGSSATASSSSPPPPPPPAAAQAGDVDKLTLRERRLKARQDKLDAKGKGKGKQRATATDKPEAVAPPAPSATSEPFDDSPLCIVYHSWEHYSSLRNISGPHTGPPRLRVGRVNSPAVNNDTAASSDVIEVEGASVRDGEDEHEKEEEQEKPEDDDEDTRMEESQDTVAPPRRTPRGSPPTDHPLPAIRSALSRARSSATDADDADARPVPPEPTIPVFPPSDSSASPSSPPSSSASSPPHRPASTDSTTRPPKHLLDRSLSQPRSYSPLSISSSSSAAPAATSDHDHDDADLDVNDNDRAGPRTRSRLASPASGSQRSAASSSSGTSTGVASSAAAAADDDDDELSESSSRASPAVAPAASSPPPQPSTRGKSRTRAPPPRERRGPTSSEKKELARVRRLERRRAKGVQVAGRADEGRVLRSGRRTSGAGGAPAPAQGDAGLGKVRELFI
ncbi:hypothetical protein JCM9279_005770 [Rhodotorula babjevae]